MQDRRFPQADRGFLARSTDADLVKKTRLKQKPHNVVEARQVSHEAPEPHAVSCVLEDFHANGLCRALLKGSVGERMMAEKSSKCLHQSSGAGENDVRKIESSAKTNDPELPEEFGRRGLLDVRRVCFIGPTSIKTCALGRG